LISSPQPIRIFTPESGVNGFRNAAASLLRERRQAWRLALRLFLRDTRAEFRQSLLGYAWIIVPPLGNTLVWVFLNRQQVVRIDSGDVPYPLFVLAGTVLWTAFNAAVMSMLTVLNSARGFIGKVKFPHESLVYAALMKTSVDATIPLLLIVPALFIYGIGLTTSSILFAVAAAASILLGSALGLIAFPIGALYSDVARAIQFLLRFGFFVTPVIYGLPGSGSGRTLMLLNPLTSLIVSGRSWLAGTGETMPAAFMLVTLLSGAVLITGLISFKVVMPHLVERVGD
jgi:lipopolysaccharide transport system permease protein